MTGRFSYARKEDTVKDPKPNLYVCDSEKQTECSKKCCYLNYGLCRWTKHKEFAVTDEEGRPLGYTFYQFCNLTDSGKDVEEWPEPTPLT